MLKRSIAVLALVSAVWVGSAFPAIGTVVWTGSTVTIPSDRAVADDVVLFGQSLNAGGSVAGDLTAFGGEVAARGVVGQDATLAGGRVEVRGDIGDDLHAAGGDVSVWSTVVDNAAVAGGSVVMSKEAGVGRDLYAAGGNVRIEGNVGRNLRVAGGKVILDGEVGRNVWVQAQDLTLGSDALIRGNLVYTSPRKARLAPDARVLGRIEYTPQPRRVPSPVWKWSFRLLRFLALFVIGAIVLALSSRTSEAVADRVLRRPGLSLGVGFLVLVLVPILVVVIAITLIGIPLALILLAMYLILIYVSRIFVGLAIGKWLFARLGRAGMSLYLEFLVGLLILWLLIAIPFVGWLVHLVGVLVGVGALAAERYSFMRELRAEGRI